MTDERRCQTIVLPSYRATDGHRGLAPAIHVFIEIRNPATALKRAARPAFDCELLHARFATAFVWCQGHRAIGDDGRCPTIARLGVSSLDLASLAPTGGALFLTPSGNARCRVQTFSTPSCPPLSRASTLLCPP